MHETWTTDDKVRYERDSIEHIADNSTVICAQLLHDIRLFMSER